MDQPRDRRTGALYGLAAAALFGASAPLAKRLLPQVSSLMLAGMLYGGAGVALVLWGLARGLRAVGRARVGVPVAAPVPVAGSVAVRVEAALRRADIPYLVAIVVLGGVVGPVCMLTGLRSLSGISGALLLNLEGPLTALLAVLFFREHLGRRSAVAIALIVGAAALIGAQGQPGDGGGGATSWRGALAIATACLAWAVDNNLTQRLSVRDPIAVVRIKALAAGACNVALALLAGAPLPPWSLMIPALAIGAASYGLSVVLDFHALRILGAAREAAFFATAPFAGALVAIPVLGDRPGRVELAAGLAMIGGVVWLFRERHDHLHTHDAIEHDHLHTHDDHHQHAHDPALNEPHAHPHRHDPVAHAHPHTSDIHHRHRH